MNEIGDQFQMNKYSSVSSIIERVKVLIASDRRLKDNVENLILRLSKSQEQSPCLCTSPLVLLAGSKVWMGRVRSRGGIFRLA